MAMAVRWCDMKHIAQCSMTRASPEATGRHHRATTPLRIAPEAARAMINTTIMQNVPTLLAILMATAMRRYYTACIA